MSNPLQSLYDFFSEPDLKIVYFCCEQEILDFTIADFYTLKISSKSASCEVHFDKSNIIELLSFLKIWVFKNKNLYLLTWNFKNFVSYCRHFYGKSFPIECSVRDLKLLEFYVARYLNAPENFIQAYKRFKSLTVDIANFKDVLRIHDLIYRPLMQILPEIENACVINRKEEQLQHSFYDVTEKTSRLKSYTAFKKGFSPLNIQKVDRANYFLTGYDRIFLNFDFNAHEVFVLQWLSKDPVLGEIITSGKDVYVAIFEKLFDKKCTEKDRNFTKKLFLPVIYGQTTFTLSKLMVDLDTTFSPQQIIDRIVEVFSGVFTWINVQLDFVRQNGFCIDHFGRKRYFESGEEATIRNFIIQSPAAINCLNKLILLFNRLEEYAKIEPVLVDVVKIPLYIHDGYFLDVSKNDWKRIYKLVYEVLTSEDDLCPGLKLRVSCNLGTNCLGSDMKKVRLREKTLLETKPLETNEK